MRLCIIRSRSYSRTYDQRFNDLFRHSMSRIGSQAMILTAGYNSKQESINHLHGMTLSSVSSLSVKPIPLVEFNLHLPSYTSQSLHSEGILALHILPPTPRAVSLGRVFASGVKRDISKEDSGTFVVPHRKGEANDDVFEEMTTPFKNIPQREWFTFKYNDSVDIPIIKEAERVFLCEKYRVFEVDSHELWVARVTNIIGGNPKYNVEDNSNKTGGLLYFNRAFHRIGDNLNERTSDIYNK